MKKVRKKKKEKKIQIQDLISLAMYSIQNNNKKGS